MGIQLKHISIIILIIIVILIGQVKYNSKRNHSKDEPNKKYPTNNCFNKTRESFTLKEPSNKTIFDYLPVIDTKDSSEKTGTMGRLDFQME